MSTQVAESPAPLKGGMLWLAAIVLAAANFIAVLDMTIANVSVSNIAGSLGASLSQGTWVVTSYAVAEAITVPLTGWLVARFGAVRVFTTAMACFGLFSALCGMANSLGLLVLARVFQGLSGGPLMALSQTLLMRIFPPSKVTAALALWTMTTLIAPVLGPLVGGYLCDEFSWPWIFLINLPLGLVFALLARKLLARYETQVVRNPIDKVGLLLLVVWVGALQLMLDEGKDLDWFASSYITALAIVAAIGFVAFVIWEWYDAHPVVDLRVFRHRGFTAGVMTLSLVFGAYFGTMVLLPLWLQSNMGYTALESGQVSAWSGVFAFSVAPVAAALTGKTDPRRLIFGGVLWMGLMMLWRAGSSSDMGYWQISVMLMGTGLGMPFFFIHTTGLILASVDASEKASAAGLMNFVRTVSGAFVASLVTTAWEMKTTLNHADLVGRTDNDGSLRLMLESTGMDSDAVLQSIDRLISGQSVMLATNELMTDIGLCLLLATLVIWLVPKPQSGSAPHSVGH